MYVVTKAVRNGFHIEKRLKMQDYDNPLNTVDPVYPVFTILTMPCKIVTSDRCGKQKTRLACAFAV